MSIISIIALCLIGLFILHAVYSLLQAERLIREHGHNHVRDNNLKVQRRNLIFQVCIFLLLFITNILY